MTTLPTGEPLVGRWVRLDLLSEADIDEMYPILSDPAVYADGYVMHRRPTSLDDARDLARSRFLASQGEADGKGGGRTIYAIRLVRDGDLGPARTLVGTSSLAEADLYNESIHLGSTLYGSRWWGTQVNPESKLLMMTHCFEDCGYCRVKIQTDALNTRSQAAIAKLGAEREGVIRRDMKREDGTFPRLGGLQRAERRMAQRQGTSGQPPRLTARPARRSLAQPSPPDPAPPGPASPRPARLASPHRWTIGGVIARPSICTINSLQDSSATVPGAGWV